MSDISKKLVQHVLSAYEEGKPLNIVSGNSKSFVGREANGERLDVSGHTGIVKYVPSELVITARCGTTIKELQDILAENGQCCPFEPAPFDGAATIGGTLACNFSGPARPWFGSIRDAVLGTRLINGKGEYLKFGGQVMKNVAGYDVSRLQAGALGTLGVITEISMKVLPRPAANKTISLDLDIEPAINRMNEISGVPVPISASAWLDGKLFLRFQGARSAVNAAVDKIGGTELEEDTTFWQELNQQSLPFFQGDKPLWRFSVNSSMAHCYEDEGWIIDWGGAQRWLRGDFDIAVLSEIAMKAKGHVSLFKHGDRRGEVFQTLPTVQQKMLKNVKHAFDPKGILNAGRLYSWL